MPSPIRTPSLLSPLAIHPAPQLRHFKVPARGSFQLQRLWVLLQGASGEEKLLFGGLAAALSCHGGEKALSSPGPRYPVCELKDREDG